MWGFAAGLAIGSVGIAWFATFGSAEAQHLPACETPILVSWVSP
jgi:hypothetical protein